MAFEWPTVEAYLQRVNEQLITDSDDAWLLSVETHVAYTFTSSDEVERTGGSWLSSKAHGNIAALTIRNDDGHEIVTHVEPARAITWGVAKILLNALRGEP